MAFELGATSRAELKGVHPDIVRVVELAITLTEQDFGVHDGLRTLAEQHALLAKGATTTLNSKHLKQADGFSHAVDLVPYVNGKLRWEWPPIHVIAAAVHQAATQLGAKLTWGAVWDRPFESLVGTPLALEDAVDDYANRRRAAGRRAFLDGPHFELRRD